MYSQCPECLARFRVSAGDLRAAGGTVRCGRCGSAFNALAWLSDTLPPPLGQARLEPTTGEVDELGAQTEPVSGVEFHFTSSDIESVFVDPSDWAGRPDKPRQSPTIGDLRDFVDAQPIIVDTESRPFEDITLGGEGIDVEAILGIDDGMREAVEDNSPTDEFRILDEPADASYGDDPAYADEDEAPVAAGPMFPLGTGRAAGSGDAAGAGPREVARDVARDVAEEDADSEASLAAALAAGRSRSRPGRGSIAWSIGGLVLALALLAQVTHFFRQDLARNPQAGPVLREIYSRIGWPLSPNWDLSAFALRQWGNGGVPDAQGQLTVRASLTNRAGFAQPHPILRLELDNRFGDAIAVRDFEPAEYLKDASEATRLLGPGASAEAELQLVDPGRDAVGYQLDVCLRESATILRCAREAS